MEKLTDYRRRRDFRRTPEPSGERRSAGREEVSGGLFVVHKHAARRLHYDLRLEQDGVLRSWAVPKEPGLKAGERRLAVQVEDHPLEYGEFEGVIPKGEYGGGTVMLWDQGRWRPRDAPATEDRLDFVLDGHRLRGAWTLVRMSGRAGDDCKNWLLIKRRDDEPRSAPDDSLRDDTSVITGRSMQQIARERDRTWTSQGEEEPDRPAPPDPAVLSNAARVPLPEEPRPLLATLAREAPKGSGWVHEIKLDGYRILARVEQGDVRLVSRNGKDWTARFPEVALLFQHLPAEQALLDGELVALGPDGISSFRRLQEALSAGQTEHLVYQAFDLLHLDGHDLAAVPLTARKQALARLLGAAGYTAAGTVRYTDHLEARGAAFFQGACRLGLEGIICKRADTRYRSGRRKEWLKVKCIRNDEFLVGGFSDPGGTRSGFGSLLLGAYRNGGLVYTGRVGTGFSESQLHDLHARLRRLEQRRQPFEGTVPDTRGVHCVRPELVVEVEFTNRTRDGRLRHPAFRGLREDKTPEEIILQPEHDGGADDGAPAKPAAARPRRRRSGSDARVAGVRLSNPDRVLFPEQGVTKLDLAHYYEQVADWILPQLADRPLALLRCPEGREKQCFFQKHPGEGISADLPRVQIEEKKGSAEYVYVQTLPHLVALVQVGVLEIHPWGGRADNVERPDILVFDLDPGPGVSWTDVLRAAGNLGERLDALGLPTFVRTTGGKGLHLVVPLARKNGWDDVKAFARAVAEQHARDDPRRLTATMSKSKRQGRIFLDYLRNGRGATAIASYSARAREGAPVAVPVGWQELSGALRSDRYNIRNLRRRLSALRADPWAGFSDARLAITADMRRAVGLK